MPTKFYHIYLQSGKDVWINPDHIVFAESRWIPEANNYQWELTMDNGFKFDFPDIQKLDNRTLSAKITAKHPA